MKRYHLGGFEVWEFEELTSTNTRAAELVSGSLEDKSAVLTFRQTQGKGQSGNKWESEPGKNLSVTLVFKPYHYEASRQFVFSMVMALGCRDFIGRYTDGCLVKWPNDVYVNEKKIAGILIEHSISGPYLRHSLCGIGINLNQREFYSDAPNPVSLFQLTRKEREPMEALEEFLLCVGERYRQIEAYEDLEKDFMKNLYRREGTYRWEDAEGLFYAKIRGIDEFGRLLLVREDGKVGVYGFKEVAFK